MPNCRFAAFIAAASIGLSGCATVVNGTSQDYQIASDPSGASVRLSNGAECVTPCELSLKRAHDLRADFALDGYEPAYVLVQSKTGGASFGNILAGGVIGAVVDSGNGSNNFLSPRPLNVRLAPLGSGDTPMLLDDDGKVTGSVLAHNDEARPKVANALGRDAAGYKPEPAPEQVGEAGLTRSEAVDPEDFAPVPETDPAGEEAEVDLPAETEAEPAPVDEGA